MACYQPASPEKVQFLQCPWDEKHSIVPRKYLRHVVSDCPSKGKNPNLVQCKYDLSHVYPRNGEAKHVADCPKMRLNLQDKQPHQDTVPRVGVWGSSEPRFSTVPTSTKDRRRSSQEDDWSNENDAETGAKKKLLIFQNPSEWRQICFDPENGALIRPLDRVAYSRLSASEQAEYKSAVSRAQDTTSLPAGSSNSTLSPPSNFRRRPAHPPVTSADRAAFENGPPRLGLGRGRYAL